MATLTFDQALQLAQNYCHRGQAAESKNLCEKLLAASPDHAETMHLMGLSLGMLGQPDAAVNYIRRAITADSSIASYHSNLAMWLATLGHQDEAAAACLACLALQPDHAMAHYNLGNIRMDQDRLDEAAAAFRAAVRSQPHHVNAIANLGLVLHFTGKVAEAMDCYRASLAIDPTHVRNHSSLVFASNFNPVCEARDIAQYHAEWNRRHAEPLRHEALPHSNERSPHRKLRIGYVSSDFSDRHPVGRQMQVLFREHDRQQFEIVAFSATTSLDLLTDEFRKHAKLWRDIATWDDARLTAQIRADSIDILIDLSLHSAGNRLLAFARRPAPVQVTFAGYPSTTGLTAIDYRLTDRFLDRDDRPAIPFAEKPFRLPDSFWCFDPFEESPEVSPLPALQNGAITFGSLNNFAKVNTAVIDMWAEVLKRLPNSRMVILCHEAECREDVLRQFAAHGVERPRVEFVGRQPRAQYLALHHRLDAVLDTFPYNGHSTTCEALWMGVPVVSLAGDTTVSRGGLSILSTIGLPELVAESPEEFTQIACRLTNDLPRLADLRASLRERMRSSPLMDAPRFTRHVETAFRTMWQHWCAEC